jgi:KUP system potassium uptake protein
VLGVLSLIFWSLILVVTVKYVLLIMRADNRGEGGILALTAAGASGRCAADGRAWRGWRLRHLSAPALFFGDGMHHAGDLACSRRVEGLEIAAPALEGVRPAASLVGHRAAVPACSTRGTAQRRRAASARSWRSGSLAIGVLGLVDSIARTRRCCSALYAAATRSALRRPATAWRCSSRLGSVVLAVTGAEALYADMGHFGRTPIQLAWFGLVLPALLLNYFGQGALLLRDPAAHQNPFFLLVPDVGAATRWWCWPRPPPSSPAQAVISARYSLARAGDPAGLPAAHGRSATPAPRARARSTCRRSTGPLLAACWCWCSASAPRPASPPPTASRSPAPSCCTTHARRHPSFRRQFRWSLAAGAGRASAPCSSIDLAFFSANALKIPDGGWFPLVLRPGRLHRS